MPIYLAKVCDSSITICAKEFTTVRVTVPALIFKRPMYLGLIFFTDQQLHQTGTGLISCASQFLGLSPLPHSASFKICELYCTSFRMFQLLVSLKLEFFIHWLCTKTNTDLISPFSCCLPLPRFHNPGAWDSVVVKALRYKWDGLGIGSRWCHWGLFPQLPTEPCALESTLKMITRDFSWGKGGRCVRLTTYHPRSAERQENPGPWATPAC